MTKADKELNAAWVDINQRIYQNVVSYVIGPKYNMVYIIDAEKKHTWAFVIRIPHVYGGVSAAIYFDGRIRIAADNYESWGSRDESMHRFYAFQDYGEPLPANVDDYVDDVTSFLRAFLYNVGLLNIWVHAGYPVPPPLNDCPEWFEPYTEDYLGLMFAPYSVKNMDDIRRITEWMRSKKFKRLRGDYGGSAAWWRLWG